MPKVDVRKGMPPRKLDRGTFEERFLSRFKDAAFAPLRVELQLTKSMSTILRRICSLDICYLHHQPLVSL
jgi:hypothetical protein